jgi:hypothetical protein
MWTRLWLSKHRGSVPYLARIYRYFICSVVVVTVLLASMFVRYPAFWGTHVYERTWFGLQAITFISVLLQLRVSIPLLVLSALCPMYYALFSPPLLLFSVLQGIAALGLYLLERIGCELDRQAARLHCSVDEVWDCL